MLENGGVVTTKRQDLICDEIAHHIEAGKLVTKVAPEDHAQRFDADFVLFTSVVMEVLDAMIKALGGESPGLITTPSDEQPAVGGEAKQPENTFH